MKKKSISLQIGFRKSATIVLVIAALFSGALYGQDITMIKKADTINQHVDIQYSNIEISQIINFDKLIRVYINSNSIILIDLSIASLDNVDEIVYKKLKTNINNQNADLTPESILNTKNELKILIRKSVYTSKADFSSLVELVNSAIWELRNFYCTKVYNTDYKSLTKEQQNNINQLVPLINYLADDVTF